MKPEINELIEAAQQVCEADFSSLQTLHLVGPKIERLRASLVGVKRESAEVREPKIQWTDSETIRSHKLHQILARNNNICAREGKSVVDEIILNIGGANSISQLGDGKYDAVIDAMDRVIARRYLTRTVKDGGNFVVTDAFLAGDR